MDQYAFRIQFESAPTAGQVFQFSVPQEIGKVRFEVTIGSKKVDVRDCIDPPCYESVRLPTGSAGQVLRIRGRGERGVLMFEEQIGEAKMGGSMDMESSW